MSILLNRFRQIGWQNNEMPVKHTYGQTAVQRVCVLCVCVCALVIYTLSFALILVLVLTSLAVTFLPHEIQSGKPLRAKSPISNSIDDFIRARCKRVCYISTVQAHTHTAIGVIFRRSLSPFLCRSIFCYFDVFWLILTLVHFIFLAFYFCSRLPFISFQVCIHTCM